MNDYSLKGFLDARVWAFTNILVWDITRFWT